MNLKTLRLEKGLSQEKLADLSGLSLRTIQRIEKEQKASIESINALCTIFDLDVNEMKSIIEEPFKEQSIEKNSLLSDNKIQSFLIINFMLFSINIITTPEYLWFIFPLFGWGVPLFIKVLKTSKQEKQ